MKRKPDEKAAFQSCPMSHQNFKTESPIDSIITTISAHFVMASAFPCFVLVSSGLLLDPRKQSTPPKTLKANMFCLTNRKTSHNVYMHREQMPKKI